MALVLHGATPVAMAPTSLRIRISPVGWDLPGLFNVGEWSGLSAGVDGLGHSFSNAVGGALQPIQGRAVLFGSADVQLERDRPLNLPPLLRQAERNAARSSGDWQGKDPVSGDLQLAPALRHAAATVDSASASAAPSLGVLSFNVLAPVWAAPTWYPQDLDPALLDRERRLTQTQTLLRSLAPQLDVICLQEVTAPEFQGYLEALGPAFNGAMAQNDRDWWSNWLVPEIPWEANGTAVIVRSSRFQEGSFDDVSLPNGNHASVFEGIDAITGQPLRVQSVHLDSDRISHHKRELSALFDRYPATNGVKDILAGDFNEDTDIGTAAGLLKRAGYSNVLSGLDNVEATHPWSSSYNGNQRWGRIDHITVRNGIGLSGDVLDFGVWSITNETERISANFQNTGSDHFPVFAELAS